MVDDRGASGLFSKSWLGCGLALSVWLAGVGWARAGILSDLVNEGKAGLGAYGLSSDVAWGARAEELPQEGELAYAINDKIRDLRYGFEQGRLEEIRISTNSSEGSSWLFQDLGEVAWGLENWRSVKETPWASVEWVPFWEPPPSLHRGAGVMILRARPDRPRKRHKEEKPVPPPAAPPVARPVLVDLLLLGSFRELALGEAFDPDLEDFRLIRAEGDARIYLREEEILSFDGIDLDEISYAEEDGALSAIALLASRDGESASRLVEGLRQRLGDPTDVERGMLGWRTDATFVSARTDPDTRGVLVVVVRRQDLR